MNATAWIEYQRKITKSLVNLQKRKTIKRHCTSVSLTPSTYPRSDQDTHADELLFQVIQMEIPQRVLMDGDPQFEPFSHCVISGQTHWFLMHVLPAGWVWSLIILVKSTDLKNLWHTYVSTILNNFLLELFLNLWARGWWWVTSTFSPPALDRLSGRRLRRRQCSFLNNPVSCKNDTKTFTKNNWSFFGKGLKSCVFILS